eukprot:TRINITY_DN7690_c0_g4_i2.p1 TRINITY_DN7690_c0_g4~~TRINITY_DN7690_c0_g4_i2.p1  ORF type:complete len:375 (+),score=45.69 TRINITY_DN7690_c0_g4_i2:43-1167(+)
MRPNRPEVQKESESETTEHEFSENERGNLKFRGVTKKDRSPPLKDEKKGLRAPNFERNIPIPIKNNSNFVVRTIWTIILLVGFIVIIFAGHIYCAGLVLLITVGIFKEVLSLKRNHEKDSRVPFSASLNYYFFGISVFFFYGRVIPHKLTRLVLTSPFLQFILTYHNIISFMLWVVGFLGFVLSLKRGFYRYQFRQFGWTHITCFLIVSQTSAIVTNIFEGLIWFILPSLLVICNDIFAYIFGVKFGRTPLIELSPKKTWEGFIGGLLSTLLFAFFFSRIFLERSYLLCPQTELAFSPFSAVNCEISNVFHPFHINLPPPFRWLGKYIKLSLHNERTTNNAHNRIPNSFNHFGHICKFILSFRRVLCLWIQESY